ncbi:MAG TPA: hypothetical protein VGE52_00475, partial [Pirellulales bacterium]
GDDAKNSVVIEERGVGNTEKWVSVGGKLVNGGPFIATGGKVIVDLKGGDDSLTIRSAKGGSYVDASIKYDVDLGAGNDSFTFSPSSVTGGSLLFDRLTTGDGKDKVTLNLGVLTSTTVGLSEGAFVNLGAGDDQATLAWKTATDSTLAFGASGLAAVGFDFGLGKDKLTVDRGDVSGGEVNVAADLGDAFASGDVEVGDDGNDTAKITGNGKTTNGADVTYTVYGGKGNDSVSFDDDRTDGDGSHQTRTRTHFDLGAGNDSLSVRADGDRRGRGGVEDGDHVEWELEVELGEGDDKYAQTIAPGTWGLTAGAAFSGHVEGEAGDDKITVSSVTKTLNLDGAFDVIVNGGGGDDRLGVALGNVERHGEGHFNVEVRGRGSDDLTGSDDDFINASANFLAGSTPNPTLQNGGPGTPGYVPTASFLLLGDDGADHVGIKVKNGGKDLSVHTHIEPGDDNGDDLNEHVEGEVEVEHGPEDESGDDNGGNDG